MEAWLYRIKIRQKLRQFSRRFQRPVRVDSLEKFYGKRWRGSPPNGDFLTTANRPSFFFNPDQIDRYVSILDDRFPQSRFGIISRADRVRGHLFDLLGSGETYLGDKIDWHLDFKSGHSWPMVPCTRVAIVNPSDDADVKLPWELSRLQHVTDLGRAYWLTRDIAYRDEFVDQIRQWEKQNPVGYGVNWTCPMEVAIRAVNIIWGLYFFSAGKTLSDEFVRQIIRLLYYHGLHIEKNLEIIGDGSNTNHLLADYLGLLYLGMLFPEYDRAERWRRLALDGLEKEIRAEVFEDGADYEGSTSYHRLVLEIFLTAHMLAAKNGETLSREYSERLGKMLEFSMAITPPSGNVPLVGDNDDGFIVRLSTDDPSDHSRLVETGLIALGRALPENMSPAEDRLWYHGPDSFVHKTIAAKPNSRCFQTSGYAVIARDDFHLMFNAGRVSSRCLAGHKHNDNLSITLEMDSVPYLIDPGTYCYTSDFEMRNRCRSTAAHNTVTIDTGEQSRFSEKRLFHLFNDARAAIDLWINTGNLVVASGTHRGYSRLTDGIVHRRTIWAFLEARSISILDEFTGESSRDHTFVTSFMTPVGDVQIIDNTLVRINHAEGKALKIGYVGQGGGILAVESSEYYPRYGVKAPAKVITCTQRSVLPFRNALLISDCQMPTDWWQDLSQTDSHRLEESMIERD